MAKLSDVLTGLVADGVGFAITGVPVPAATAATVMSGYLKQRQKYAVEIALEELGKGKALETEIGSIDDAAGSIIRYMRAANEGAARVNLRLLARVMCGQLQNGILYADKFLQYADALASLSREEIIVVATLHRFTVSAQEQKKTSPGMDPPLPWARTKNELSKSVFDTPEHVEGVAARAQRSGLVASVSAYGGIGFRTTPFMEEVAQLVDLYEVLAVEETY